MAMDYDVVITTYGVVQSDQRGPAMRHRKGKMADDGTWQIDDCMSGKKKKAGGAKGGADDSGGTLTKFEWHRIVLDESHT